MRQLQLIIFCLLFFLHSSLSSSPQSGSLQFKLHRRPPVGPHRPSHLKPLFLSDLQRQHWIRSTIRRNLENSKSYHPACHESTSEAFEMPIGSGAYTGTGQYFVRVRVGTPARPFLLVADTGSDLTWVKCRRHNDSMKEKGKGDGVRVFKPEQSSSWRPIECSTDLCRKTLPFALATCPAPDSPCVYDYGYANAFTIFTLFNQIKGQKLVLFKSHDQEIKFKFGTMIIIVELSIFPFHENKIGFFHERLLAFNPPIIGFCLSLSNKQVVMLPAMSLLSCALEGYRC